MTRIPSTLWLHPPLGFWSPLHSAGGWIKTMKVHTLLRFLDPYVIHTTSGPMPLARVSPKVSTTCNELWELQFLQVGCLPSIIVYSEWLKGNYLVDKMFHLLYDACYKERWREKGVDQRYDSQKPTNVCYKIHFWTLAKKNSMFKLTFPPSPEFIILGVRCTPKWSTCCQGRISPWAALMTKQYSTCTPRPPQDQCVSQDVLS